MANQLIILKPGINTVVTSGGTSVQVCNPTLSQQGGIIANPLKAVDQGLAQVEPLYVSLFPPPVPLSSGGVVTEIVPGQWFLVPPQVSAWVNAASSGHKFTAYFSTLYTPPYPPGLVPGQPGSGQPALVAEPGTGVFPPDGPTGLLTVIPSYLYQEYSDDDDLQGFVAAQNDMQQNYVDTFNALNLPIYTGPIVAGPLLDWVGRGIYGMARPALGSGIPNVLGPLNTWGPNFLVPLNEIVQVGPQNVVITNDDVYRRILTWHFYKGDGKYFSSHWLKRRVWRFLYGVNGTAPDSVTDWPNDSSIADMEQISLTLGVNANVTIRFVLGKRDVTGGALLNAWGPNGFGPAFGVAPPSYAPVPLNDLETTFTPYPPLPFMSTFKEALDSGVLELPYQYNFTCHIG